MGQIQQMVLTVYKKDNKLYLDGYAKAALGQFIEGDKEQYYMVTQQELYTMIENAKQYDLYVGKIDYDYLPHNADIYKQPLVFKYTTQSEILFDVRTGGIEYAKSRHLNNGVSKEEFEKIILDAMINLSFDYMREENKELYDAVECASKDFKCDNNVAIIMGTLKEIDRQQKQQKQTKYNDEYTDYFRNINFESPGRHR